MKTSARQRDLWNEEHRNPTMLLPMDSAIPSSSLPYFRKWLVHPSTSSGSSTRPQRAILDGIEMGCGKGRNCIALAKEGIRMTGFDFSKVAIEKAKRRARIRGIEERTTFIVADAREQWPFPDESFDCGLDCFATTDIETEEGRAFARDEFVRILKPGGLLFVATISSESPYHREKLAKRRCADGEGFLLEKTYSETELRTFYKAFSILALERKKKHRSLTFDGKKHDTEDFWLVLRKPQKSLQ